ncbi:MAG: zinc ribbon domain-containing protein [Promethearchaeota archaeon]
MINFNRKSRKILFSFILICQVIFGISLNLVFQYNHFLSENIEIDHLKLSQTNGNSSIETFLPRLAWLEVQVKLNISSNESGQIFCYLNEFPDNSRFYGVNQSVDLIGSNVSQTIHLIARPSFLTFPGIYRFELNITGIQTYNENFEVIFVLGYSILTIISISFFICLIIILIKHRKTVKSKSTSQVVGATETIESTSVIKGKIKCPECRKSIDEGLTFCPECGARIPEFLRYNPPGM